METYTYKQMQTVHAENNYKPHISGLNKQVCVKETVCDSNSILFNLSSILEVFLSEKQQKRCCGISRNDSSPVVQLKLYLSCSIYNHYIVFFLQFKTVWTVKVFIAVLLPVTFW